VWDVPRGGLLPPRGEAQSDAGRSRAVHSGLGRSADQPHGQQIPIGLALVGLALAGLDGRQRGQHHPGERPTRYEYRLTAKGRDLNIALSALRQWGDKYLNEKPPRLLRRKADKKPVIAAFVPKGADVLRFDELELVPGPGLKMG
jgi:hypothetical protein